MLSMDKKRSIGRLFDGTMAYSYGSYFFAITENGELLERSVDILRGKDSLGIVDLYDSEQYEYLEEVSLTNHREVVLSAVLDIENAYVFGNKVDLLENTINEQKFIFCSSMDYMDFEYGTEEYNTLLEACRVYYGDGSIDDLSVLADDLEEYVSFVVFGRSFAVLAILEEETEMGEEKEVEEIQVFSLDDNETVRDAFEEGQTAIVALYAMERMYFDECSLLTLDEIEERKRDEAVRIINGLRLEDVKLNAIADTLDMNYKSLSASKRKAMYFNLYKQKLISYYLGSGE